MRLGPSETVEVKGEGAGGHDGEVAGDVTTVAEAESWGWTGTDGEFSDGCHVAEQNPVMWRDGLPVLENECGEVVPCRSPTPESDKCPATPMRGMLTPGREGCGSCEAVVTGPGRRRRSADSSAGCSKGSSSSSPCGRWHASALPAERCGAGAAMIFPCESFAMRRSAGDFDWREEGGAQVTESTVVAFGKIVARATAGPIPDLAGHGDVPRDSRPGTPVKTPAAAEGRRARQRRDSSPDMSERRQLVRYLDCSPESATPPPPPPSRHDGSSPFPLPSSSATNQGGLEEKLPLALHVRSSSSSRRHRASSSRRRSPVMRASSSRKLVFGERSGEVRARPGTGGEGGGGWAAGGAGCGLPPRRRANGSPWPGLEDLAAAAEIRGSGGALEALVRKLAAATCHPVTGGCDEEADQQHRGSSGAPDEDKGEQVSKGAGSVPGRVGDALLRFKTVGLESEQRLDGSGDCERGAAGWQSAGGLAPPPPVGSPHGALGGTYREFRAAVKLQRCGGRRPSFSPTAAGVLPLWKQDEGRDLGGTRGEGGGGRSQTTEEKPQLGEKRSGGEAGAGRGEEGFTHKGTAVIRGQTEDAERKSVRDSGGEEKLPVHVALSCGRGRTPEEVRETEETVCEREIWAVVNSQEGGGRGDWDRVGVCEGGGKVSVVGGWGEERDGAGCCERRGRSSEGRGPSPVREEDRAPGRFCRSCGGERSRRVSAARGREDVEGSGSRGAAGGGGGEGQWHGCGFHRRPGEGEWEPWSVHGGQLSGFCESCTGMFVMGLASAVALMGITGYMYRRQRLKRS